MGENTTNGYFYKPSYGASGTVEKGKFDDALDIADAQIEANKTVTPSFDTIQFNIEYSGGQATGRLQWNDTDGTLEIGMKGDAVKLQVGQEFLTRVVNKTGVEIVKGKPVYVNGMQAVRPTIALAKADSRTTIDTLIGLTTENIANNAEGYVTLFGLVRDVDTSDWEIGDILYVSPDTAGLLTTTRPSSPNVVAAIGSVFVKHSSQGLIGTKVTVLPTLTQLSDTPENYTGAANKFLQVNSTPDGIIFDTIQLSDISNLTNIVLCSNYNNPDDAIIAIDTADKTLLVTEAETCDTNFTVPANVTVRFERGGKWTINTGVTVTFNGQIDAGLWQIFAYTGTGTLAGTPQVKEFNPQWFGALGDGSNDDTTAITNTIAALPTYGGVIYFPYGTYKITSTITVNKRCKIYGAVRLEDQTANSPVMIKKDGDFTGILITTHTVIIDGITIKGHTGNGGIGIHIRATRCVLQHVSVHNHGSVGIRIGDDSLSVNCNAWRLNDVSCKNNGSHGVLIDDISPIDVSGGSSMGLVCDYNGGDGLRVARAVVNNFHGLMTQGNTGAGLRVTTGAIYNSFWNPHSEANTGDEFVFDAGVSHNSLIGSFVTDPVDNGTNMIMNGKSGQWKIYPQIYVPSIVTAAGASLEDAEHIRFNRNTDTNRYNSIYSKSATEGNATLSFLIHDGVTATSQKKLFELFGNGILSVPCGQLKFPATQVPSANVNTLDDYKEGEWTPALKFGGASVGMTYATQAGEYTKIGRKVTLTASIILSAKGSSVGDATITGLPFTSKNSDGSRSIASVQFNRITFANTYSLYLTKNSTTLALNELTEAGTQTALTNADFANDSTIFFSITYFTD